MKQKLSITSRILVAFASGALIAVFFLPVWRIDLFAPQYPEGLTMNIWINGLSGEVDVINGLNHYIGMKHITVDMFPEFKFLPYVVGFFMLLGMLVAISGNRRFLLYYLILSVIGGAVAMFDFYKWGYNYGHNLDPTAPIQVPGLSYQPPLFGHKRILNFDAYSFPDVGGWIVVAAGILAFSVFAAEWYRHRKNRGKVDARSLQFASLICLLLFSCKPKTESFQYGKDNCSLCKMGIVDPKFGGEIVTKKSKVYKFDDAGCMAAFLRTGDLKEKDISKIVLINFEKENDFIESNKAAVLINPQLKSPMGSHAAAFITTEAAEKANAEKQGRIVKWDEFIKEAE